MGLLVNGKWVSDDQSPPNLTAPYKNKLGTPEFPFDPKKEPGRYHLYISHSCPFAQRVAFARAYYNLDSAIGLSRVDPGNTEDGWSFVSTNFPETGDNILGKTLLRDVYLEADPNYTGRVSVPLLIDTKPGNHTLGGSGKIRIVSGESADLVDELEKVSVESVSQHNEPPAGPNLMGIVLQAAKAKNETELQESVSKLETAYKQLDTELANKPYLEGDKISNVDLKVFPFLVQVETLASIVLEKPPQVSDFKNLSAYATRVYNNPSFKNNVRLDQTRLGMYKKAPSFGATIVRQQHELQTPQWLAAAASA